MNNDVVVIGGGAAGMFAAINAARAGHSVTLLEKNSQLGKKLNITGKGRCNLTNNCDFDTLMANIPKNSRFLYSAFSKFSPQDVMRFFEELGVELKTERGARVFPMSDQAREITEALRAELSGVDVLVKCTAARHILTKEGRVIGVACDTGEIQCNSVILATGGVSYPTTGSTGDGYRMASELGHSILPLEASLVPLVADTETCVKLQGLTLKNIVLSVFNNKGKRVFEDLGEMLFTHFGVSGPLVLSASSHMRDIAHNKFTLSIDMK
ncbi:MAG: aminoacetone oxidase family FAD-binding enzyme, partial [Clostridia bacterium]